MIQAVTFIIIRPDRKILMQLRDDGRGKQILYPNMWSFPGGGRDGSESYLETVLREAREEFGLELREEQCELFMEHPHDGHTINQVFLCRVGQDVAPELHEGSSIEWMTMQEIKKLPLAWEFSKALPKIENKIAVTALNGNIL